MKSNTCNIRLQGMRPVWTLVPKIASPILRHRGFSDANILKDWRSVVGEKWSEWAVPERIYLANAKRKDGVLHIRVYGSAAVMIKHIEPVIIERVNSYLGFKGVSKLRIIQDSSIRVQETKQPINIKQLDFPELEIIKNEELKDSLARLGSAISAKSNS